MSGAVILIHGFCGGLREVEYLGTFLKKRGKDVYAVTLAGHGKTRADLKKYGYAEWISYVERDISNIIKKGGYEYIDLVGFSMGGLIAENICVKFPVRRLAFVNTPIYFWNIKQISTNIFNDIRARSFENIKFYVQSSSKAPLIYSLNFLALLYKTKKLMLDNKKRIKTLIIQSLDDDTVKPQSALFLKNTHKGESHRGGNVKFYRSGGHLIFAGEMKKKASEDIFRFLEN